MKKTNELIFGLLISIAILFSCEDKNDDLLTPDNKTDYSESIIVDFNTNQVQCNITIDSLHPHVINNFASHIELPLIKNGGVYSIFQGQSTNEFGYIYPLNPVVEYIKDEFSVKKIIASWDKDSTRVLTDSIYFKITKIDSNFHERLSYNNYSIEDSTIIYINLLNINRYGYSKINFNDSDINSFLVYDINTSDSEESSINITPQDFQDKYGDAFCSSLVLGTFNLFEGVIYGVNAQPDSRNDALKEAVDMVKLYLSEEKDWEELVTNSTYLKNSIYLDGYSKSTMGYSGGLIGNYNTVVNSADSLYQLGEFNQYSSGYKLYSDLYKNFDFIDMAFPY